MSKKYIPSGYQIITIDSSKTDEDGFLIIDNEDAKSLKELFEKGIMKPVLLTDTYTKLSGFCLFVTSHSLHLSNIVINEEDSSIDVYSSVELTYTGGKIEVVTREI